MLGEMGALYHLRYLCEVLGLLTARDGIAGLSRMSVRRT
jgi:hypothetical protein